jgi:hypothetical protein
MEFVINAHCVIQNNTYLCNSNLNFKDYGSTKNDNPQSIIRTKTD